MTQPAFVYGHDRNGGYSITGGIFVRNQASIAANGYVFGDYASGRYWYTVVDAQGKPGDFKELLVDSQSQPVSFHNDSRAMFWFCHIADDYSNWRSNSDPELFGLFINRPTLTVCRHILSPQRLPSLCLRGEGDVIHI